MKTVTYAEAVEILERKIAERGEDFVYNSDPSTACYYSPVPHLFEKDDVKSWSACGVGEVLAEVAPAADARYVYAESSNSASWVLNKLSQRGIVYFTPKARHFLTAFQVKQDQGAAWGPLLRLLKNDMDSWDES